ncbi:MAG: hypothetical protein II173_00450, partial [Firmicutes bacterium]|nr:hypothetical protein [Bacillota bacterium]
MTLASFIKVTQAAFFGQLPARLADVEEAPGLMLLPMYIMSLLCVGTGIFYDKVYQYLLDPAVRAAFTVSNYIDRMMGDGYAEAAGVEDVFASNPHFSYWNPVIWLALFVIVFCAAYICVVTSKGSRGQILSDEGGAEDGKYATFFSGEKALPSHVAGSDLFWGFKTDWKGYFRVMEGLHSGIVNDYALYVVAAAAFVVVFTFAFLR